MDRDRPIELRIADAWKSRSMKIDWLELEDLLVTILGASGSTGDQKCAQCREAIDAITRRGHFVAIGYDYGR